MLLALIRDRLEVVDTRTQAPTEVIDMVLTIPARATRILLLLDPAVGSTLIVSVLDTNTQAVIKPAETFEDGSSDPRTSARHIELVYDVSP
jgi:hypothetical protein